MAMASSTPSPLGVRKRTKSKKVFPPPSPRRFFDEPPPTIFPSKEEFLKLFAVLAIAVFVAVACNYIFNSLGRKPVPFCDSGGDDGLELQSDFCKPCPEHGVCSSGSFECAHGYKKTGSRCVEDAEISQMAKKFINSLKYHVCKTYARVLCGETGKVWFKDAEILQRLEEFKDNETIGLKDETLTLMRQTTLETLESFLETRISSDGIKEFKCPDNLAELHKPFSCAVRQYVYRNMLLVLCSASLFAAVVSFSRKLREMQYISARSEQIYEQICDFLEERSSTREEFTDKIENWVVLSWLRDYLLLPKERKNRKLWKKVEELVQEDSRIDRYPKLIKGEPKVVLEWQVEGSLSAKMRSKGEASKTKARHHVDKFIDHQKHKTSVSGMLN